MIYDIELCTSCSHWSLTHSSSRSEKPGSDRLDRGQTLDTRYAGTLTSRLQNPRPSECCRCHWCAPNEPQPPLLRYQRWGIPGTGGWHLYYPERNVPWVVGGRVTGHMCGPERLPGSRRNTLLAGFLIVEGRRLCTISWSHKMLVWTQTKVGRNIIAGGGGVRCPPAEHTRRVGAAVARPAAPTPANHSPASREDILYSVSWGADM